MRIFEDNDRPVSSGRTPGWRRRPTLDPSCLVLLVALFIVAVDNRVFWRHLTAVAQLGDPAHLGFGLAVGLFLVAALSFLLSLFAWRFLTRPFLATLLMVASIIGYFMNTYGVVVDDTMLANVLQTDEGEAAGLFNAALVWYVLLTGVLPSLALVWVRLRYWPFWRMALVRFAFAASALAIAGGAVGVYYKDFSLILRENRDLRLFINPTYAIYSAAEYLTQSAAANELPLKRIGLDAARTPAAKARERRKVMILVVGETTRAANWGLTGYRRQTTPELAAREVVNFPDAQACGTSTAVSVPCMFSPLTRENYDGYDARHSENLLDVLARAGVTVRWEENQAGGCKGVCARVPTRDMRRMVIPGVCGDGHCLDAVFQQDLKRRIAATRAIR